jgi:MFS family permease
MATKAIPVSGAAPPAVVNPLVTELAEKDTRRWYQKPNLRSLYLLMVPGCLGVEYTSGFDSSMINGIQTIPYWEEHVDYPAGARLGILTASYSLGSLLALPLVPLVNERWGRKVAIYVGSVIMIIGAVLQGASQHCKILDAISGALTDTA